MFHPYNNGGDHNTHGPADVASDPHHPSGHSRHETRLPPLGSLVYGAPSSSTSGDPYLYPHPQPQPRHTHQRHTTGARASVHHAHPGTLPRSAGANAVFASDHHQQHYPHHPRSPEAPLSPSQFNRVPQGQADRQPPYPTSPYASQHPSQQQNLRPESFQTPCAIAPSAPEMGQVMARHAATAKPADLPSCLNLLGENRSADLEGIQFSLKMRQQPRAARSCGFGDKDRRVIDPPPIVELTVDGPKLRKEDKNRYLRYSQYIASVSIYDEFGARDASLMPEEYRSQRRLMGSLSTPPTYAKDEFGKPGCFFCFQDLSCRTPGSFRLQFSLVMLNLAAAPKIKRFPNLSRVMSDVFTVYNAKDFPGMMASSKLARRLKEQGCIIPIKKGADRLRGPRSADDMMGDSDDSGGDEGEGRGADTTMSPTQI